MSDAGPIGAVGVGLVGFGMGGSLFHAPFIAANPDLELVAVVTTDARRQAGVRERHRRAQIAASVDEPAPTSISWS
jgi:scyllo-inositol 2-dehydrogenase (NADP+)